MFCRLNQTGFYQTVKLVPYLHIISVVTPLLFPMKKSIIVSKKHARVANKLMACLLCLSFASPSLATYGASKTAFDKTKSNVASANPASTNVSSPKPVVDNKALSPAERPHFSPMDKGFIERFLKAEGYIPVDEIKPGMEGYGLTVFQGTKIERFNVKVIGVIRQVLSGRDAILVRTSGANMGKNNVVRGMSGSPIYINDRLAGALSYGFDFSKEPIVGVTPVVDMLDALSFDSSGAPRRLTHLPKNQTRDADGVLQPSNGPTQVQSGSPHLVPLMAPVSLSGYSTRARQYLEGELKDVGLSVSSGATGGLSPELISLVKNGGRKLAQKADTDDKPTFNIGGNKKVVPGQAVSVMLSTGDFASAATGTATCAFDNKFIAFGHAFLEAGSVSFPLATAYIHEILPSLSVSFKLSSPMEVIGTIFADRPWSVGGQVGRMPELLPVKLTVSDEERGVRKIYNCQVVEHPDLTKTLVTAAVMSSMDATFQSQSPYVVKVKTDIDVEGHGRVERTDRFAVNFPAHLSGGSTDLLARLHLVREPVSGFVGTLVDRIVDNDFQKARVTAVNVDITVDAGRKVSRIERIALDKGTVAPGDKVTLSCTLKPFNGEAKVEKMVFTIPRDLPDGDVAIGICGGDEVEALRKRMGVADPQAENLGQIINRIKRRERADKLCGIIALPRQSLILNGEVLRNPPAQWIKLFYSDKATKPPVLVRSEERVTRMMDDIIDGAHVVAVTVKRADKLSAKPLPFVVNPPVVSAADGIYMTEQARKALDSGRKGEGAVPSSLASMMASMVAGSSSSGSTAVATPAPATPAVTEKAPAPPTIWSVAQSFPHMRGVNVWRLEQEDKLRAGLTDGVIVDSMGRIYPGFKELDRALVPNQSRVFASAVYKGMYYFCAGKSLYSYNLSSKSVQQLADLPGLFITSLVIDDAGKAYLTTSGKGEIYTCNVTESGTLSGAPVLVTSTSEEVITAACLDEMGRLYVGTNSSGKVYRLDKNTLTLLGDLGQAHITALHYSTYDGRLYVGTAERGIVVSFGDKMDMRSEYETGEHIVTGVAKDKSGNLYVTTAGQGKFMRITPRGAVDVVALSDAFYTLYYDKRQDRVYSGDAEGDITRIEVDKLTLQPYFLPVCHTEQEAVLAISADDSGHLFVGTSNIAEVIALSIAPTAKPTYTSTVFDSQKKSNWSRFRLFDQDNLENPELFNTITVETRGGVTAMPDASWSDWSSVSSDPVSTARLVTTAPSRYLQYRLTWQSTGEKLKNSVGATEVTFQPTNSAPTINSVSINSTGAISGTENISITASDPDSDNVLVALELSGDGGKTWSILDGDLRSRSVEKEARAKAKKAAKDKDRSKEKEAAKSKAEAAKSEASKSDIVKGDAAKGEDEKGENKPDSSKSEAPKNDSKPESTKPESAKPESSKLEAPKGDNAKPEMSTPESKDSSEAKDSKEVKDSKDVKVGKDNKDTKEAVKEEKEEKVEAPKAKEEGFVASEKFAYVFDSKKHKDGEYLLRVTISDRPSNARNSEMAVALKKIVVDNTAPRIENFKIEQGDNDRIGISFTATDNLTAIADATYKIEGYEPFSLSPAGNAVADGLSVQLKAANIFAPKSSKKITVEVFDRAGNKTVEIFDRAGKIIKTIVSQP